MDRVYYTYTIRNKEVDKLYIGSRTKSDRIDILDGYYTSSKVVRNLIEQYGVDSFEVVDVKTFNSIEEAVTYENDTLQSIKNKEDYLNINFSAGGSVIKSQTHVQIYNELTDEYMYHPKQLDIPTGWIKQSSFQPPSRLGYKHVVNLETGEIGHLKPTDTLPDGWVIKTEYNQLIKDSTEKKTEWITDGNTNKRIELSQIGNIPDGWRLGKVAEKPTIRITDGTCDKYVFSIDEITEGWTLGSSQQNNLSTGKGMIKINNGIIQKRHPIDESIPEGWMRGDLPNKNAVYYTYKNTTYNYKKDICDALGLNSNQFDWAMLKNKYAGEITIFRNGEQITWADVSRKDTKEYICDGIKFKKASDLHKHLGVTSRKFEGMIKRGELDGRVELYINKQKQEKLN